MSFTENSHIGSVRKVTCSAENKLVATGGVDESIVLLNLNKRKNIGTLAHHTGE